MAWLGMRECYQAEAGGEMRASWVDGTNLGRLCGHVYESVFAALKFHIAYQYLLGSHSSPPEPELLYGNLELVEKEDFPNKRDGLNIEDDRTC